MRSRETIVTIVGEDNDGYVGIAVSGSSAGRRLSFPRDKKNLQLGSSHILQVVNKGAGLFGWKPTKGYRYLRKAKSQDF